MTEAMAFVPRRRRRPVGALVVLALLGLALIGASVVSVLTLAGYDVLPWRTARAPVTAPLESTGPVGVLDTELMPVSRDEAERLNAERPADDVAVVAAKPFAVTERYRETPAFYSAVQCLTQAVYYEAAVESDAGQRAVAQVVLNRVRHPAFPNSVCGVVYQGSERATGCQFSFTCDGSLARQPSTAAWARARRVALAALSGWVEPAAGTATHYHASYVLPYWASSLDKVLTVGTHIFYVMRGSIGSRQAFTARYDMSGEVVPVPLSAQAVLPEGNLADMPDIVAPNLAAPAAVPVLAADRQAGRIQAQADAGPIEEGARVVLRADERQGTLNTGTDQSRLLVD